MPYPEKRGDGPFPWSVKHKKPGGGEKRVSGFATEDDAMNYGHEQEADLRRGKYHDPKNGEITLDEYFRKKWLPAQDLSDKSRSNRAGEYRTHLAPRWGSKALNDIEPFEIAALELQLKASRAPSTRRNVMDLLRFMLEDAVHAKLLQYSPILPRQRRGKREADTVRRGQLTTLAEVLAIGERLKPGDALMTLVTFFTGMRWSEVSGMRRSFLTLHPAAGGKPARGHYVIDEKLGAVHEDRSSGRRSYGPPKGDKGRTVQLPPFLVVLLLEHLATFPLERDALFVNNRGQLHNHSSFINNHWRPACDGWAERPANRRWPLRPAAAPIHRGLWFHDLRHTHKTALAEAGIEPVARDERLGHATPGMDGVYIHVTEPMRARILVAVEEWWATSGARSTPTGLPIFAS